ncbi:phenoloxidase-activating factor 2-like, partial [Macrobrachium nipponense]|uniref:phenoloxidase-activating factor 2-like n=1 Tax=Macrobrachium nipponense TaxID=159736 RepID=UPI0030C8D2A9
MSLLPSGILLLLCALSRAQNPNCPAYTHDCVPFYQCVNGVINTSGGGLIDPRIGTSNGCTVTDTGEFGVCCQIPGSTNPNLIPCSGGQICVEPVYCSADGTVNTDGTGLIDIRRARNCLVDNSNDALGICCSPTGQTVDRCPGDAICVEPGQCTTRGLSTNSEYLPYGQGGSWTKCRIQVGPYSSTSGICCQRPNNRYEAARECGVRHSDDNQVTRIRPQLAKTTADFGEYPWQAVVFHRNFTFNCGATLISNQWLVTAAHCVSDRSNLKVRLGEWVVNDNQEPLQPRDFEVTRTVVHPNYNSYNLHNDIALMKLDSPVNYEYHINRVCVPRADQAPPAQGTRCFATGWGKNAFDGQYQATLKQIDIPVVEQGKCQRLLRRTRLGKYFRLDDSFVCAGGEPNRDVCKGDGGGPLVCQDPWTGNYFLYGITAWGISCGEDGVPGVYVNVQKFSNWIWQNAESRTP